MPYFSSLLHLVTTIRAWWQRQLAETASAPPYPLTQDEWDFIREQEAALPQARALAPSAKNWVDANGRLIGSNLGSGRGLNLAK